ncbi:MAG: DUF1592 domain-containing protein [Planctomycetaceae bacterium]|nr:DUF1592 domain-containing protein [Planctomycetaceae bacterium]
MSRYAERLRRWTPILLLAASAGVCRAQEPAGRSAAPAVAPDGTTVVRFLKQHCVDCHSGQEAMSGLSFDVLSAEEVHQRPEIWEQVIRKLASRQMPPPEMPRPDERSYDEVVSRLASSLDRIAAEHPNPGRTESLRRLNRTEYQNAIRDLLDLEIDVTPLLPPDESSHGFDNITVTDLSPTLLNRYVSAAQKLSRLAIGGASESPAGETIRIRPDVTQDSHVEGLPIGTRGGTLISYNFPQDGDYEVQVRLMRDRNEEIEGLREPHELEVSLDRERVELFTVKPPGKGESNEAIDANLKVRLPATAGAHKIGVTFLKKPSSLLETERQPLNVHFNYYRHPRIGPAVYEVSITGPYHATGPGDTASRRRLLVCKPTGPNDEDECARRILSKLMRRAYRRPIVEEDLVTPLAFFRQGREENGFEGGIETALSAVLVNPQFLFRIERDPAGVPPGTAYRISDLELASRLSFFLWSSIPDDELLHLAERRELSRPEILERQVRRMLADERSRSLVTNFAGQWLYLRNLDSVTPDMRLFPDFDDNLRQAFRRETELFFESVLREDRSVLALIDANDALLNERLAKHYDIPHVYGSRFRRVELDEASHRGGLLRQGSLLTVTSYATRTSPVIRGDWVLKNLVGTTTPPPPPDVPALEDNTVSARLSVRERLAAHRADASCAVCHDLMDPVGLTLENFDAVGRWREVESGDAIDASGGLPDGSAFSGVAGLEQALLARPEIFVSTLTEKLMTFAIGRGIEFYDAPAIRQIVRDAKDDDYRFSSLIFGIVKSTPFQMRMTE